MKINLKKFVYLLLVAIGLVTIIYSIYSILRGENSTGNIALLVLGCILMVCGALLRYTETIEQVEEEIEHPEIQEKGSWRMQDLEYRLKKVETKDAYEREFRGIGITEAEFGEFKALVDSLLGKLDPKYIKQLSMSDNFKVYEEVMSRKEEIDEKTKKQFIALVDGLFGKLPREEIVRFVNDTEKHRLYQKVVQWSNG